MNSPTKATGPVDQESANAAYDSCTEAIERFAISLMGLTATNRSAEIIIDCALFHFPLVKKKFHEALNAYRYWMSPEFETFRENGRV